MFKGEDITGLKPHLICHRGMARTFQTTKLFTNMSAFDNVKLALLFGNPERKIGRKEAEKEINQLFAVMGMLSDRNKPVKDMSLAMQKRLEIVRALATNPQMLLLDEVMSGLDAEGTDSIHATDLTTAQSRHHHLHDRTCDASHHGRV